MFGKKEKRRPKVGLGVIVHRDRKVLVGKRKNSHGAGNWGFPGGHIEWNETFEQCALRELEEETGIRGANPKFISATNDVMPLDDQHYITIFMLVENFDGEPELREPERCEGWRWMDWDDLPEQRFSPITRLIETGYHPSDSSITKEQRAILYRTKRMVQEKFEGEGSGHDWWHISRVWKNAKAIAKEENVDQFIVELGALLHDIADWKDHDGDLEAGPRATREWLEAQRVESGDLERVVDIVRNVAFKGANVEDAQVSPELEVVRDADRLDAIGAIGIARAFTYGGSKGRTMYDPSIPPKMHDSAEHYHNDRSHTVNHFYEKMLLLKDRMGTEAGRRMAESRHAFMEKYLKQFYDEWNGGSGSARTFHQKLVRDKIPEIIRQNGDEAVIRVAESEEYRSALKDKLLEESREYIESEKPEELADTIEVIYKLAALQGVTPDRLERLRQEKREARGGFDNRIILEETR